MAGNQVLGSRTQVLNQCLPDIHCRFLWDLSKYQILSSTSKTSYFQYIDDYNHNFGTSSSPTPFSVLWVDPRDCPMLDKNPATELHPDPAYHFTACICLSVYISIVHVCVCVFAWAYTCHNGHVEVRGQHSRVGSVLLPLSTGIAPRSPDWAANTLTHWTSPSAWMIVFSVLASPLIWTFSRHTEIDFVGK